MFRFPTQFAIGPVRVAPATVLAPMAGVTDTVFRRFIRNLGGCGLLMTEFTSSHGVSASLRARQPTRTLLKDLAFDPVERPISTVAPAQAHAHAAEVPGLRSRGAPHHRAVVRRRSGSYGRRRARLPGPGIRRGGYQFRLPRQQG